MVKPKDARALHELRSAIGAVDVAEELVAIIAFNDFDPFDAISLVSDVIDEVTWFSHRHRGIGGFEVQILLA